jgi:ATP-dependent RNA helicase DeaD
LEKNYGNLIDPKRYGDIRTPQKPSLGTRSGDREASNQVRIYVQLGRKDGFNPREIASYFSQLLGIPQRMVDRIDTAHAFTLLSLPKKEALEIIERTKWDKSLPHMHLDTKENARVDRDNFGNRGSQGRNGRRGNSFSGESARGSRRASFSSAKAGFKEGGARKNAHPRDYSSRGKTSSAALYKKA